MHNQIPNLPTEQFSLLLRKFAACYPARDYVATQGNLRDALTNLTREYYWISWLSYELNHMNIVDDELDAQLQRIHSNMDTEINDAWEAGVITIDNDHVLVPQYSARAVKEMQALLLPLITDDPVLTPEFHYLEEMFLRAQGLTIVTLDMQHKAVRKDGVTVGNYTVNTIGQWFLVEPDAQVLVANWYANAGSISDGELAQTDGDLEGLLQSVKDMWLDTDEGLTDEQIGEIMTALREGGAAAIPTNGVGGGYSRIIISAFDRDDDDIQYLLTED